MTAIPPVDGLTISAALRCAAKRRPDDEALVFPQAGSWVTYAEYDARVDEVAVNPAYRTHELAYALRQSDTKVLFLIDRFKSSDYFGMIAEVRDSLPRLRFVVSMKGYAPPGILTWPDFLGRGRTVPTAQVHRREVRVAPGDPANLQCTSGATGLPKGVLLSHRSILLNAWYVGEAQRLGPGDRVCVPVPFYHCFGITGRIKEMIIRGGENIYPREIEEFLYTRPAVESAQAVGVPDPRFGEEVCVWIELRRGATADVEEIRDFCRKRLAYFKVPRYVKFVDEFPLTVTGKVQKFRIREMAIEELGLSVGHGRVAFDDTIMDSTGAHVAGSDR